LQTLKTIARKRLKKSKDVFYKRVLKFSFASLSMGQRTFNFHKKVKIGVAYDLHVLQDARALRALAPVGNEHNDDYDDEEGDAHAHGDDDRLGEGGIELVVVQLADVEAQPLANHDNDVGQLVGVLAPYNQILIFSFSFYSLNIIKLAVHLLL
jgi:hypothetical protein